MGLSSHQICMNSSDYSQSVNHEGYGSDSSASPSGDMLISSIPLEKRPRPENDQVMKCPRCDSTHTKFCYYNNYSLTQPRYFCKTCRRYWTKGGSLRNIPVGGGCRKNKRSMPSKKSNDKAMFQYEQTATNLHGAFSEVKLSDLTKLFGNTGSRDFMGTSEFGLLDSSADVTHNFQEFCSPFEMSINNESGVSMVETNQIMPLFESEDRNGSETVPNTFLSLDWQDHGRAEVSKESGGFLEEFAAWNSLMNGYGSSTADLLA